MPQLALAGGTKAADDALNGMSLSLLDANRSAAQVRATGQALMQSQRLAKSVSQALIGQLVTLYAIGSMLAAIPLTIATRGWRRRPGRRRRR